LISWPRTGKIRLTVIARRIIAQVFFLIS